MRLSKNQHDVKADNMNNYDKGITTCKQRESMRAEDVNKSNADGHTTARSLVGEG